MKNVFYALIGIPALVLILLVSHFTIVSHKNHDIAPEFKPIYSSFLQEAKQRGFNHLDQINISIQFNDLNKIAKEAGKTTLGECSLIIGVSPKIKIDRTSWVKMNYAQQEMTIFHELGHCFLLKGHTESNHEQIISLMNPFIFNPYEYQQKRGMFLNEMFSYKPYHLKDYAVTFFMEPMSKTLRNKFFSKQ